MFWDGTFRSKLYCIVLVSVFILVPIPFSSLPKSLAKDVVQSYLLFPLIKWRNSNEDPVFGSILSSIFQPSIEQLDI